MTLEEFKAHCNRIKPDPKTGCRLWDKGLTGSGYPGVHVEGKDQRGNRVILSLKLKREIRKGFQALHTCDNRRCVEFDHIYEGTPKDNVDDRTKRKRHRSACGREHGLAKKIANMLTAKNLKLIRKFFNDGKMTRKQIVTEFGLSRSIVFQITKGTHWSVRETSK